MPVIFKMNNEIPICCMCKEEAHFFDPEYKETLCIEHNRFNDQILEEKGSKLKGILKCRVDVCLEIASDNAYGCCKKHFKAIQKGSR